MIRWLSIAACLWAQSAQATPTAVTVGEARTYVPSGAFIGGVELRTPVLAAMTGTATSAIPVDDDTTAAADPALDALFRIGLTLDTARLSGWVNAWLEAELDVIDGVVAGGARDSAELRDPPLEEGARTGLRRAWGRVTLGPFFTVGGGFMTSHWGLGLLANDGAHGWTPGSARFSDPRGGDRVLRGFAATGPWTDAELMIVGAVDQVQGDDVLRDGDAAWQAIGAVTVGDEDKRHLGLYIVHRVQETRDGKQTTVQVADLFGRWTGRVDRWRFGAAVETAMIVGETDLGPSTEHPVHDVVQLAVANQLSLSTRSWGVVLDTVFASGDRDTGDGAQNAFKADPNFEQGLLLFRHVVSANSARAPVTAADPDLVGVPAEDLDRLTTRGAVTNTVTVFPRVWGRIAAGLEIYGGPLFAFGAVELADPLQSRLAGGEPTNGFGGKPGSYLGTELDVGVRYRALLWGTELTVGVEAGLFTPGSALEDDQGHRRGAMSGGRAMLQYRL